MDFANYWFSSGSGGDNPIPFPIADSLRFRDQTNGGFNSAGVTPTNNLRHTFSVWVKWKGTHSQSGSLLTSGSVHSPSGGYWYNGDGRIRLTYCTSGNSSRSFYTTGRFRDPAAWYHLVFTQDTTQATESERMRLYVNGVRITSFSGTLNWPLNTPNYRINTGHGMNTGCWHDTSWDKFCGYMAEMHFVDGQPLEPTEFGEFNEHGVWVPIEYTGTYGNAGFYRDFSDPADILADRSGNGNNASFWGSRFETANSSSTNYDCMTDSPTVNDGTLNVWARSNIGTGNVQNGNLRMSANNGVIGSIAIDTRAGGRFYAECRNVNSLPSHIYPMVGVFNVDGDTFRDGVGRGGPHSYVYRGDGVRRNNSSESNYGSAWRGTANQIVGILFDADTRELSFTTGGTNNGVAYTVPEGRYVIEFGSSGGNSVLDLNCGQQPWGQSLPNGYAPWGAVELPNAAITNPSEHFQTILDTGANILTNAQATFPNGLWWIKDRVNNNNHQLLDSVRGGTNALRSNTTDGNTTYSAPSGNSVAWCWNLEAGNANGFNMFSLAGNSSANRAVAHGLGKAPEWIMVKCYSTSGSSWAIWHTGIGDADRHIFLNSSNPYSTSNNLFGGSANTFPDATNFYLGANDTVNQTGRNYMVYCWTSVPGYSAFGSYKGNGNSDGSFVYTGFRPAFVLIKRYDSGTGGWVMKDTARKPYNPADDIMRANSSNQEFPQSNSDVIDILSNGFKCTSTGGDTNSNGYIFCAFAEHPFGGGNVAPSPAR